MANFTAPIVYTYTWVVNSGSLILWNYWFSASSYACSDIQTALNDMQAPDAYPVECDFITLDSTGAVFFMDTDTQQLTIWLQVSKESTISTDWIQEQTVIDIYGIETAFICVILMTTTLIRNLRKISPNLFL